MIDPCRLGINNVFKLLNLFILSRYRKSPILKNNQNVLVSFLVL